MTLQVGAVLFALAVVVFVVEPIITRKRASLASEGDEPSEDEARKRVALLALRDVEYDYHTGKLDDEDYRQLRGELTREALRWVRAVDRERERGGGAVDPEVRLRIEREIAELRAVLKSGRLCPACGHANPEGSKFCARCGTRVAHAATA